MSEYLEFLNKKKHLLGNFGFEPVYIPEMAFDFQKYIIEKSIRKGRIGVFADTGLGKTLIQLSIANNVILHTNKKVLILTPLAVATQGLKVNKIELLGGNNQAQQSTQPTQTKTQNTPTQSQDDEDDLPF